MADKKTFTIEINGIEQAYNNVIKLRDAIAQLGNIELNINGNAADVLSNIEERTNGVTENLETLNSTMAANTTAVEANTSAIAANNEASQANAAANESIIGSLAQRKKSLEDLKKEYEELSNVDRVGESGRVITEKIREEEVALAAATLAMSNFNRETQNQIALNNESEGSLNQKKALLDQLKEEYKKLSTVQRESADGTAMLERIREEEVALAAATLAMNDFNQETQLQIAVNNEAEGSLNQKKALLKQLEAQFGKMTEAERESANGKELATRIVELREDVEDLNRILDSHLATLGSLGTALDTIGENLKDTHSMFSNLSTTFSSTTEVMKTFGLESQTLNDIVTNLTEVTNTLNSLQALHTSLVSKDSIVMKGAAAAKKLYTAAIQGSNVALKGFKVALASTGIGAILVLVGALVTNFDNIKKVVGDAVGGFEQFDGIMSKIEPIIAGWIFP